MPNLTLPLLSVALEIVRARETTSDLVSLRKQSISSMLSSTIESMSVAPHPQIANAALKPASPVLGAPPEVAVAATTGPVFPDIL
jgi:hypothetical protein